MVSRTPVIANGNLLASSFGTSPLYVNYADAEIEANRIEWWCLPKELQLRWRGDGESIEIAPRRLLLRGDVVQYAEFGKL